jgi:PD-(D/E)XK nuclease superfamily protein
MRKHQSWYRANVLHLPFGTGPKPTDVALYGNMLDAHGEALGGNFLSPEIAQIAEARIASGRGVEPFRCRRNMLSSQPMCFNLFGPLQRDHERATRLVSAMLRNEVAEVVDVRIEYAPHPKRDYLGDGTSFDAFFEYRRLDGERAFLGIETKPTESFSGAPVLDGALCGANGTERLALATNRVAPPVVTRDQSTLAQSPARRGGTVSSREIPWRNGSVNCPAARCAQRVRCRRGRLPRNARRARFDLRRMDARSGHSRLEGRFAFRV